MNGVVLSENLKKFPALPGGSIPANYGMIRDAKIQLNKTDAKLDPKKLAANLLLLNTHDAYLFGRTT